MTDEPEPPRLTETEIRMLVRTGRGVTDIARRLGIKLRDAHKIVDPIRQQIALMQQQAKGRSKAHAKLPHHCTCGKVVFGNGAKWAHGAAHCRRQDRHHYVTQAEIAFVQK